MYSRFYEFNNMDLYSCQDLDHPGSASPNFKKALDPTSLGNDACEDECEFFFQKSQKNLATGYEISFENGFMKEHEAVYEKELQNFMEPFGMLENTSKLFETLAPQATFNSVHDILRSSSFNLDSQRIENFLEKLMELEKLEEFLDIVVSRTEAPLAYRLVELAVQLVEKYDTIKKEEPTDSELLKIASEVSDFANIEKFISEKESLNSTAIIVAKEKAKRFLEVFCATTILVIAQFFVNPYSDDESAGLKRPLSPWSLEDSDEEENFEPSLFKKRKLSF
jgi:hypothetical protein